jgi:hypothetical protein
MSIQGITKSQEQKRHMKVCGYLTAANQRRWMGKEVRQKRRVRYLDDDGITWSDTTLWRISESRRNVILGNGACGVGKPLSPLPLQSRGRSARLSGAGTTRYVRRSIAMASGNTRLWRRTGRPRRPSATTNDNSRSRRRPGRTRNKTSSLGIELRLQVPGDGSISTGTNVLHGIVLVICIRRTLTSINHSLAFRKAIGPAMAPTAATSIRHLQKKKKKRTTKYQRVREIRYIAFSKI